MTDDDGSGWRPVTFAQALEAVRQCRVAELERQREARSGPGDGSLEDHRRWERRRDWLNFMEKELLVKRSAHETQRHIKAYLPLGMTLTGAVFMAECVYRRAYLCGGFVLLALGSYFANPLATLTLLNNTKWRDLNGEPVRYSWWPYSNTMHPERLEIAESKDGMVLIGHEPMIMADAPEQQ